MKYTKNFYTIITIFILSVSSLVYSQTPARPYSVFSTDQYGRYIAMGDSSVEWGEIFVTPSAVKVNPVNAKPDYGTWLFPGQTYLFDDASAESLYFHIEIPHDYKLGTDLLAHVHWAPLTTGTNNVAWKLVWMKAGISGTFAFTAGDTLAVRQAGSGTAYKHQMCSIGSITMTSITGVSSVLSGVLIRDGASGLDTYTGDAAFIDLGFHYRRDSFGSRWETVK